MRTFGTGWKEADVEGEVMESPEKMYNGMGGGGGGQSFETKHGLAFWRKL